jgi:HSP20 family protein
VDITQDPDLYRVELDLPGVHRDDVSVTAHGGLLRIEGHRRRPERATHTRVLLSELRFGRFARSLRLPTDADADAIRARFVDGMLAVEIPRRQQGGT